jgi:hypothetical protein
LPFGWISAVRPSTRPLRGPLRACPGAGVVSHEISDEFCGGFVAKASQACVVVIGNEGVEVSVALGVVDKAAVVGGAVLRHAVEVLAEAAG